MVSSHDTHRIQLVWRETKLNAFIKAKLLQALLILIYCYYSLQKPACQFRFNHHHRYHYHYMDRCRFYSISG